MFLSSDTSIHFAPFAALALINSLTLHVGVQAIVPLQLQTKVTCSSIQYRQHIQALPSICARIECIN
jgi:hypothetical protein